MMCDWDNWPGEDAWSGPINTWDGYHAALEGFWAEFETDLRSQCVPAWLMTEIRREWFRRSVASLRPETVALLSRGSVN